MAIIRSTALAIAASFSGLVAAADPGPWTVAVDAGSTRIGGSSGTEFGLPYRNDDDTNGWRLAVARDIWGPLSVELAHDEMGELTQQWIAVDWNGGLPVDLSQCPGPVCTVSGGTSSYQATSDTLALRASFAPSAAVRLGFEFGVARVDLRIEEVQDVAMFGASAGYRLDGAWTLEARYQYVEVERFFVATDALQTLRLGVRYGF